MSRHPHARPALAAAVLAAVLLQGCAAPMRQRWVQADGAGPVEIATEDAPSLLTSSSTKGPGPASDRESASRRRPAELERLESFDAELREALEALSEERTPHNHVRVARAYRRLHVFDDAVDHFARALEMEPESVSALDGRARLWRDLGVLPWALSDVTRAIYIDPDNAALQNTRGTILEALGQPREAVVSYARALALDPGARYARRNLCRLAGVDGVDKATACPADSER